MAHIFKKTLHGSGLWGVKSMYSTKLRHFSFNIGLAEVNAQQLNLDIEVAIKVLSQNLLTSQGVGRRHFSINICMDFIQHEINVQDNVSARHCIDDIGIWWCRSVSNYL